MDENREKPSYIVSYGLSEGGGGGVWRPRAERQPQTTTEEEKHRCQSVSSVTLPGTSRSRTTSQLRQTVNVPEKKQSELKE